MMVNGKNLYKIWSLILFLLTLSVQSQSLEIKRQHILDSINYYREDPVERVKENYGIGISKGVYRSKEPFVMDDKLTRKSQRYAEKIARTGNYVHSNLRGCDGEALDAINTDHQGDYIMTVHRLIIDEGTYNHGHRRLLLSHDQDLIGIGIAYAQEEHGRYCYVVLKTKKAN